MNELREAAHNTQFFVIGNPAEQWIAEVDEYHGFPASVTSSTTKRIFGSHSDWLNIEDKDAKMIF